MMKHSIFFLVLFLALVPSAHGTDVAERTDFGLQDVCAFLQKHEPAQVEKLLTACPHMAQFCARADAGQVTRADAQTIYAELVGYCVQELGQLRAPRPDAQSVNSNEGIVGVDACCDLTGVEGLLRYIRSRIGTVFDPSCRGTVLGILGDVCAITGGNSIAGQLAILAPEFLTTVTYLEEIEVLLIACCAQTYQDFVNTATIITDLNTTITTCFIQTEQTFVSTATVIAELKSTVTTCCAAIQSEFVPTWTIIAEAITTETTCCANILPQLGCDYFIYQSEIPYTISTPGIYCFAQALSDISTVPPITIQNVSDVTLKMQGKTLSHSHTGTGIFVSNSTNVAIENGVIFARVSSINDATNDGINVSNSSNILIDRLLFNVGNSTPIDLDGSSNISVKNTTIFDNALGAGIFLIQAFNCSGIVFDSVKMYSPPNNPGSNTSGINLNNSTGIQFNDVAVFGVGGACNISSCTNINSNMVNMFYNSTQFEGPAFGMLIADSTEIKLQDNLYWLCGNGSNLDSNLLRSLAITVFNSTNAVFNQVYVYGEISAFGFFGTGGGINFSQLQNSTFNNVFVTVTTASERPGIECSECSNCSLNNCQIFAAEQGIQITAGSYDVQINNPIILLPVQGIQVSQGSQNIVINNAKITDATLAAAIALTGTNIIVKDSALVGLPEIPVYLFAALELSIYPGPQASYNVQIIDTDILGTTTNGIYIPSAAQNVQVRGCNILSCQGIGIDNNAPNQSEAFMYNNLATGNAGGDYGGSQPPVYITGGATTSTTGYWSNISS